MEPADEIPARRSRPLAALSHRDFRLFWIGQCVSLIGTWMQSVGQSWLVLELTNSPFRLGLVNALQFTPTLFLSLVAGAVADRFPKRRLLLITQSVLMLLAFTLGLLAWAKAVRYWHVVLLATLLGLTNTFDVPIRQSFVVEMVGRDDLMNAIALNSAIFNTARIVGPALAGLTVGVFGVPSAFLFNGLSFVAVITALVFVRAEGRPSGGPKHGMWQEIREGLSYIRRTPIVLMIIGLIGFVATFALNFNVLVPVLSKQTLGQGAAGFGFLMSAVGVGALTGALSLAFLSHQGPRLNLILIGALLLSSLEIAMWWVRWYPLAVLILFAIGWSMITCSATSNSTVQVMVPDHLRGRVMSVYFLVFGGTTPIGGLFAGSVSDLWGANAGFAAGGTVSLIGTLSLLLWWRRRAAASPKRP